MVYCTSECGILADSHVHDPAEQITPAPVIGGSSSSWWKQLMMTKARKNINTLIGNIAIVPLRQTHRCQMLASTIQRGIATFHSYPIVGLTACCFAAEMPTTRCCTYSMLATGKSWHGHVSLQYDRIDKTLLGKHTSYLCSLLECDVSSYPV